MKILIIGDVYGSLGRKMLKKNLTDLKKKHQIDLTIANIENATNGRGISWEHYQEIKQYGVDFMTSGNHIFDREETISFINNVNDLIRPLNSNPYHPGKGSVLIKCKNKKIRITNLLGTVFINPPGENPFFSLEKIIEKKDYDFHLVDFHAQATAEKKSLALNFDGKITVFWGTHTHVQTADEEITKQGTVYITDIGMTGPAEGIIGAEKETVIKRNKYNLPLRINPLNKGKGQLNGIVVEINDSTNLPSSVERIFILEEN